jgi:chitinase
VDLKRYDSCAGMLARAGRFTVSATLRCLTVLWLLSFFSSNSAFASSATVAWNASTSPNVAGYFLYIGNTSGHYSTKFDAGSATTVTVNNLLQGQKYYLTSTAYDLSGRESSYSTEVNLVAPDITPPTISITSPGDGATVSGRVTIGASAKDNVDVSSVVISAAGGSCTLSAGPYSCVWNTAALSNGTYTISGTAKDAAGNATTASINVSVNNVNNVNDTTAPSVKIDSPLDGTVLQRNSLLVIRATATDNVGVTKVLFYVNGALNCTDTASPYSCALKPPKASGKTYQIKATAYDAAGNIGSSDVVTVKMP